MAICDLCSSAVATILRRPEICVQSFINISKFLHKLQHSQTDGWTDRQPPGFHLVLGHSKNLKKKNFVLVYELEKDGLKTHPIHFYWLTNIRQPIWIYII